MKYPLLSLFGFILAPVMQAQQPASQPGAPAPAAQGQQQQQQVGGGRADMVYAPGSQGSRNMHIQFHVPTPGSSDLRIDQDPSRPFVYQAHGRPAGFHVLSVKDPTKASIIYSWQIETPELITGGAGGVMLFKHKGRHYAILSVQFGQTSPASDVVAIVFDVTGLPDSTK